MFVEVHMIQNFAPANLNRDDTNNPKDCEFGGVRRARISSQCLKRAIRRSPVFAETTGVDLGTRTRWLIRPLRKRLAATGKPEVEIDAVVLPFIAACLSKLDKNSERTAVALYLSKAEIDDMAQTLADNWPALIDEHGRAGAIEPLAKAFAKKHQSQTSAPDIALFGRMLAEKPELNLDAACQVAHALSTHRVSMEMDFFTAVDDLPDEDEAGAAMMGFTGFDSACFYRYARLDWEQLVANLDGDHDLARRTVEAFLRAAVAAVPGGKQNTFAAHNPPSFMLGVVRHDGMGWSLANAFERPVRPATGGGLVQASVVALDAYWERLCRVYGTGSFAQTAAVALDADLPLDSLKDVQVDSLEGWVRTLVSVLPTKEARA